MRIATLIIGLVLVFGLFLQSVLVGGLSEAAGEEDSSAAAAVGVLMALIWIFGCALVIPLPRVAMILFALAGVFGIAASGSFPDLAFWGAVSLVLALFSFFGWRGKRKADRKERERDELLRRATRAQAVTAGATAHVASNFPVVQPQAIGSTSYHACPSCGAGNPAGARFCSDCGSPLALGVAH
jgi:hypothetical protein